MALMRPFYKLVGDPFEPNRSFAEGYDGSAWEYYGDPGIVVRTVGAAAAALRHGLAIDGPLFEYREKGSTIEVARRGDGWCPERVASPREDAGRIRGGRAHRPGNVDADRLS